MKKFVHLANRPELSFGMRTENHNGKRHYVTPEGELYPSITTVLGELSKAAIQAWRERVGEEEANKISGKASRRGTSVHLSVNPISKTKTISLMDKRPTLLNYSKRLNRSLKESITFTELN